MNPKRLNPAQPGSSTETPTVFVVDDDDAIRDAISLLLKSVGLRAELYASAAEFLTGYAPQRPGCLLLDVRMPGMSGLELQTLLNTQKVILPIVFITGHGDVPMAVSAIKQGAADFIQKPFRDQELLDCIHRVLDEDARNRRALHEHAELEQRLASLTPREHEVLARLALGMPNKLIARELSLSPRTVEIHRAHVMDKMKTRSLAVLAHMLTSLNSH